MQDLYSILNVSKDASQEDIKKAFRRLAIEHHPDKNNGNKESEEMFKKISEAYNVLSNPDKKKMYDQFGTVDDGGPAVHMDLNDLLKTMFGGGMPPPQQNCGFSFVFMDGADAQPKGNMFPGIPGFPDFGDNFPFGPQRKRKPDAEVIDIDIDLSDLYYGNSKKVEFELLDLCSKCGGSGAQDPSSVITCLSCNGQGSITQAIGPFMHRQMCGSCQGRGSSIKNGKLCKHCNGEKVAYAKCVFELKIPKGIPNNHEIRKDKLGSYNLSTKSKKDLVFKFRYKIDAPYSIDDDMNVHLQLDITLEELLAGFKKQVMMYDETVLIKSDMYFNPSNAIVIQDKGIYNMRTKKQSDFMLHFNVLFGDGDRLTKYHDVLKKIVKKHSQSTSDKEKEGELTAFSVQSLA